MKKPARSRLFQAETFNRLFARGCRRCRCLCRCIFASATAHRCAYRNLVDVAIHAALNPERLAGRSARIFWYSSVEPGEAVHDADGADGLVDDVAAVGHVELLRERAHLAGIELGV